MPEKSFLIEIQERLGEGSFWTITSKHLPGLFLGGQDLDAVRKDVPEAIKLLFKLNYQMNVQVMPLQEGIGHPRSERKLRARSRFAAFTTATAA